MIPCRRCSTALRRSLLQRRFYADSAATTAASSSSSKHTPPRANPPNPQLNISHIVKNVESYERNCTLRKFTNEAKLPSQIAALHKEHLDLQKSLYTFRMERKRLGELISINPQNKETHAKAKELKTKQGPVEDRNAQILREMDELALQLPNSTHPESPEGAEPQVLRYIGNAPKDKTKNHLDIGKELELLDFRSSAHTSGWGWYFLTNEAVLLEQALVQYALRKASDHGWKMVAAPSVVYSHISRACGFRPRDQNGEMQVYQLADTERSLESTHGSKTELCLAGTAEIPLAAMMTNSLSTPEDMPRKTVGVSRCFRAEAGARGLNTKGLYRVKEFTKVEMFAWCEPDPLLSDSIFSEMVRLQEEIISDLGLAYRVVNMPTEDMGATAHRKWDIEAFIPSRQEIKDCEGWSEVTSTSECTDYQARRLNAKLKRPDRKEEFLWSLNGTALAVPRILQAILECHWDEKEKGVRVPEVLINYMGGMEIIKRN